MAVPLTGYLRVNLLLMEIHQVLHYSHASGHNAYQHALNAHRRNVGGVKCNRIVIGRAVILQPVHFHQLAVLHEARLHAVCYIFYRSCHIRIVKS